MKALAITLIVLGLTACMGSRELPVEYDYSFRGKFDRYKTYDFFITDDFQGKDTLLIRSSIEKHMRFLGYERSKNKPDLYLNYAIYEGQLSFRSYDQPDINHWAKRLDDDLEYYNRRLKLQNGTLLIQVYDRKINSSIWQGYATDNFRRIDFDNYRQVQNAVKSILNKYQFFARGFIDERTKKTAYYN